MDSLDAFNARMLAREQQPKIDLDAIEQDIIRAAILLPNNDLSYQEAVTLSSRLALHTSHLLAALRAERQRAEEARLNALDGQRRAELFLASWRAGDLGRANFDLCLIELSGAFKQIAALLAASPDSIDTKAQE